VRIIEGNIEISDYLGNRRENRRAELISCWLACRRG
jgi:hypothetical protein